MTNTELLLQMIKDKGLKLGFIAQELHMSYPALRRLINNETDFKAWQIKKMCELLDVVDPNIKEALFFCN